MGEDATHPIDPGLLAFMEGIRMKRPLREGRCAVCRHPVTLDTLHCVIPNEGYPIFVCQDERCVETRFGPFPRIVGWARPRRKRRQALHRRPEGALRQARSAGP